MTPENPSILKIALVQSDPAWKDIDGNLKRLEKMLSDATDADIFVLPEMFSTGFVTEPAGAAETSTVKAGIRSTPSLEFLRDMARRKNAAMAGSAAIFEDGRYFNRFYFVRPDGTFDHYDKHHLFTFSGEHLRFTPGKERVITEYKGLKILLQVCYDLRFPCFARNRSRDGGADYDLALYVASWPVQRIGVWDLLLRARAVENRCYVAGVNRVGTDPGNTYPGHSCLTGPDGNMLSICKENRQNIVITTIDTDFLKKCRKEFPVLEDAD